MRSSRLPPILRQSLAPALIFSGVVLLIVSALSFAAQFQHSHRVEEKRLDQYTFVGDDYPTYYPLEVPDVSLTPENTIHYQIFSDGAADEWESIYPEGGGFVKLGPDGRIFGLALFHQLHCLSRIRQAMSVVKSSEHVHHCFNYLRQAILCEANPTIEPVIPILGRRSVNAEIPRICRDWTRVYELSKENRDTNRRDEGN